MHTMIGKGQEASMEFSGQSASGVQAASAGGEHTVLGETGAGGSQGAEVFVSQADAKGAQSTASSGESANGVAPFAVTFPEDMPLGADVLENYQAFCAECGLSSEQAQQAVEFYMKEHVRQLDAEKEFSMQMLKEGAWKGRFDERLAVANGAVRALDTQLGGRLVPVLESGLGNNHVFAEMMACIGDLLKEEQFIPNGGGVAAGKAMSTEDFLRNEVFKTR